MRPKKKIDKKHPYIQTRKNKLYRRLSTEEAIKLIKEQSVLNSNSAIEKWEDNGTKLHHAVGEISKGADRTGTADNQPKRRIK